MLNKLSKRFEWTSLTHPKMHLSHIPQHTTLEQNCAHFCSTWWRHQMETFSALLALGAVNSPVTGEIPSKRTVTRSFDVFFDLRLNERLSKQSWGWWFETPSRSLWRHCNESGVSWDMRLVRSFHCWQTPVVWESSRDKMPKCSAACGTAGVCNILGWGGMGAAIVLPWWVADGDGEIDTGLWQDCDFFPDCDDKFSFQDILKGPGAILVTVCLHPYLTLQDRIMTLRKATCLVQSKTYWIQGVHEGKFVVTGVR